MLELKREELEKTARLFASVAVILLCAYAALRLAFLIFLPFLCGIALGAAVRIPANVISARIGISKRACGAMLFVLLLALIGLALAFAVGRLFDELVSLAAELGRGDGTSVLDSVFGIKAYIGNLSAGLPILRELRAALGGEELWETVDSALAESLLGGFRELCSAVPRLAASIASSLPDALVFFTVSVLTGFYFASDGVDALPLYRILPKRVCASCDFFRSKVKEAATAWAYAYILIFGIVFFALFAGFSLLGIDYPLLVALLVALVDALPIFGAGTVLLPWGALAIIFGDRVTGVGLFVLLAAICLIRRLAEPKIFAKSFGVPAMLTLIFMYAGLRIFGVFGMIASPFLMMQTNSLTRLSATVFFATGFFAISVLPPHRFRYNR